MTTKERPILFGGEMVKAILEGRKTQTRRIVRPHPAFHNPYGLPGDRLWVRETFVIESNFNIDNEKAYPPPFSDGRPIRWEEDEEYGRWWRQCHYRATDPDPELYEEDCGHDHDGPCTHWRPSIHMPRWASRINLEIVGVTMERLQTITHQAAIAEGITYRLVCAQQNRAFPSDYFATFAKQWDTLNAKRGYAWITNPWVWVVEFCQVKA